MNKNCTLILPLFFSLVSGLLMAQTPQAFSYQAVATDNRGKELVNRAIGIRASILRGSPSGQAVWVETHQVTTDDFGLFTIPVGQGAPQPGAGPAFSAIDWSAGPYFLRIDMDADGGSNYAFVGASQLLSVPYALYSEHAAKAARANQADNALLAQRASLADSAVVAQRAVRAALADSAALAQLARYSLLADSATFSALAARTLLADSAIVAARALRSALADTAAVAGLAHRALYADYADSTRMAAQAVQANGALVAGYADIAGTAATTNFANSAGTAQYAQFAGSAIDDFDRDPANELQTLSINRDTIRISNGNAIALTSVSPFHAPGATLDFPEGTDHAFFLYIFNSYTVPAGRNFYITAAQSEIRLPNVGNALGRHFTTPSLPLIPAGTTVSNCRCTGFLVSQTSQINPVVIVLQPNNGNSYQVPNGRYLVIKSGVTATMPVSFDGTVIDFFSSTIKAMIAPSGVTLRNPNTEEIILTGYLKNNQ